MHRPTSRRGPGGPELFCLEREPREVAPGAVHVPDWLDLDQQRALIAACRLWVRQGEAMRAHTLPSGGVMSVRSTVLGLRWDTAWHDPGSGTSSAGPRNAPPGAPTRWTGEEAQSPALAEIPSELIGGNRPTLPEELRSLSTAGIARAYGDGPELQAWEPTTALVNFYDATATMGMHQDRDEPGGHPIVSISLGDTCLFRFGNTVTRSKPYEDIELRSGDLFVFGRESRWAFHGVPAVRPGSGDPGLGMREGGRLNITIRQNQRKAQGHDRY